MFTLTFWPIPLDSNRPHLAVTLTEDVYHELVSYAHLWTAGEIEALEHPTEHRARSVRTSVEPRGGLVRSSPQNIEEDNLVRSGMS